VLTTGDASTPRRVPADLGQLIVAVSDRTGLGETEATELVYGWAEELREINAIGAVEAAAGNLAALSYVEEQYRRERWSQLQALWLILATPFLDPQTGTSAAVRPARSVADVQRYQSKLGMQWTHTECLLQARRRLVAEYSIVTHLMARLESPECFFEGERRALAQCIFTLAYGVQFTAQEALTLVKLLRQMTLSIGSGISGLDAEARITRGPLHRTSLNEAIDVLMLLSLSVRGVLDPTRYHPLENLRVHRGGDSPFSANKLLEDAAFIAELERLLGEWYRDLPDVLAFGERSNHQAAAATSLGGEMTDYSTMGSESSTARNWHAANLAMLLHLIPLIGALFLMATPETGSDPSLVDKYLQMALEGIKRGALAAILGHWVPWLEQQPDLAGDALRRPGVGTVAPFSVDLFADFVMDLGAAGVVSRLFETAAQTIAASDMVMDASHLELLGGQEPRNFDKSGTGLMDKMMPYRGQQLQVILCSQITRVMAASAQLAPENAYRLAMEPMGEFHVDLIRIVGDAYLDLIDLLYARLVDNDFVEPSAEWTTPELLDERISSVLFPMLMAFLDLLRHAAVCAEPVWDYLENGGHPIANYAQLMRGLDVVVNRWQISTDTFSSAQIRQAEILAGLVRVLTSLTRASMDIATFLRSDGELVEQCLKIVSARLPMVVQHAAAEWLVQVCTKDPAAAAAQVHRTLQRYGLFQTPLHVLQDAIWKARDSGQYGLVTNLLLLGMHSEPKDVLATARFAVSNILCAWDRYTYVDLSEGWSLAKALVYLISEALEQEASLRVNAEQSLWSILQRPSEVTGSISPELRSIFQITARACLLLRDEWWCPTTAQEAAVGAVQILLRLARNERSPSPLAGASRQFAAAGMQVARLLAQCSEQVRILAGVIQPVLSASGMACAAASLLATLCIYAPAVATTLADTGQLSHHCSQVLLSSTDHRLLQAVVELLSSSIYAGARTWAWPQPPFRPLPPKVHPSGRLLVGIGATSLSSGAPAMALVRRLEQLTEWPLVSVATPLFQFLLNLLCSPELVSLLGPLLLPQSELKRRSALMQWLHLLSSDNFSSLIPAYEGREISLLIGCVMECTALVMHCADMESDLGVPLRNAIMPGIAKTLARELLESVAIPLLRRCLALATPDMSVETLRTPLRAWHKLVAACFEQVLPDGATEQGAFGSDAVGLIDRCLDLAGELAGGTLPGLSESARHKALPQSALDAGAAAALFSIIHCCQILWRASTSTNLEAEEASAEYQLQSKNLPVDFIRGASPGIGAGALRRASALAVAIAVAVRERPIANETRLLLYATQCTLLDLLTPMPWPLAALDAPMITIAWNCQSENHTRWTQLQISEWIHGSAQMMAKLEQSTSCWVSDATADGEAALRAIALATLTLALQLGASLTRASLSAAAAIIVNAESVPRGHQMELFSPNRLAHLLMITNASALARAALRPLALYDYNTASDVIDGDPARIAVRQLYLYEQHISFFIQAAVTARKQGSILRMLPDLLEALHAWVVEAVDSGALLSPNLTTNAPFAGSDSTKRRLALARRMAMLAANLALQLPNGTSSTTPSWRNLAQCAIRLGSVWLASRSIVASENILSLLQLAKWYGRLLCALPDVIYAEQRELDTLRHSFVLQYLELLPRRKETERNANSVNDAPVSLVVGAAPWDTAVGTASPLLVAPLPHWEQSDAAASVMTPNEKATPLSGPMDSKPHNPLVLAFLRIRLELLRIALELNMGATRATAPLPSLLTGNSHIDATSIGAIMTAHAGESPTRRMRAERVSQGMLWLVSECVSSDQDLKRAGVLAVQTAPSPASVTTTMTCPSRMHDRNRTQEAMLYRELLERSLWFLLMVFEPSPSAVTISWPLSRARTRQWIDWLYGELERRCADSGWLLCRLLGRRIRQWIPPSDLSGSAAGSSRDQTMILTWGYDG
jgi:hypothetical protein